MLKCLQNHWNSTIFTLLIDGWADGKNISMSISKLLLLTKNIYGVFESFESCCFKLFIKLSINIVASAIQKALWISGGGLQYRKRQTRKQRRLSSVNFCTWLEIQRSQIRKERLLAKPLLETVRGDWTRSQSRKW